MKTAFATHRANRAESAGISFRGLLLLTGFALLPLMLAAVPPAWWQERGVLDSGQQPDDFAAVNTGQLKHIAKQAMLELDARIPGGAGTAIHQLIDAWPGQTAGRNDFAAVNTGQVKAVARLFYDRLNAAGYTQPYPWNEAAPGKDDFAGVNVGQLKAVFAFCVDCQPGDDTDGDGLGDAWEMTFFGSLAAANGDDDNDQDGIKNYVEFHYHSSPSSSDSDADGLADNAEILTFGTNPAATDTDGDGWGDGQEHNHQSDPKAAASTPLTVNPNLLTQIIRVNVERMRLDNTWWGETALTVDPPSAFHYSFQTRIAERGSGAPAILPSYPVIDNQYEFGPGAAAAPDMTLPLFSALTVDFAQLEVAASSDDETIGASFLLDHDGDIDYTAPIEWEDTSHYLEFRRVHLAPYVLRLVSTEPVPFAVTYPLVTERRNRAAAPGSPEAATETASLHLVLGAGKTIGTPQIVSPSPTTDLNAQWETQVRPFDVPLPLLAIEVMGPVETPPGRGWESVDGTDPLPLGDSNAPPPGSTSPTATPIGPDPTENVKPLTEFKIAKMTNTVDGDNKLQIGRDPDRFLLRIPGLTNAGDVRIKIATEGANVNEHNDDATELRLIGDFSGNFVTDWQVLVSNKALAPSAVASGGHPVPPAPADAVSDDDYTGDYKIGPDDQPPAETESGWINDCTHVAELGSKIVLKGLKIGGNPWQNMNVVLLKPIAVKKEIPVRFAVMSDTNTPDIQGDLMRANERWAQVGIKFSYQGPTLTINPQDVSVPTSNGGHRTLSFSTIAAVDDNGNGGLRMGAEAIAIVDTYNAKATSPVGPNDILMIYCKNVFTPGLDISRGQDVSALATFPSWVAKPANGGPNRFRGAGSNPQFPAYANKVFMSQLLHKPHTVPHELGHLLLDQGHFNEDYEPDPRPSDAEMNRLESHNLMRKGTSYHDGVGETKRIYEPQEDMLKATGALP